SDFDGYQRRFGRDVAAMNKVIKEAALPSLVAMVVDQYPVYNSRGHRIAQAAETYLSTAGAEVIPTDDYYRQYTGKSMYISNWEGHPNEVANWIWANMIAEKLRSRPDLALFKR